MVLQHKGCTETFLFLPFFLQEWHCQLLAAGRYVAKVGAAGSFWLPVVFGSLSAEQQLEALKQLQEDVEAAPMLLESETVSREEAEERVPMPQSESRV
jgi:hypothetical protein